MHKLSSLAIALLLAGCGGGSGSDSQGNIRVYSSTPSINIVGDAMSPITAHISFDSQGVTAQKIYLGVASESPMVKHVDIMFTSDTGGLVNVELEPGYKAGNGTSKHQISMLACFDEHCHQHVPGSPIKATIHYSVELNERASLEEHETIHYRTATNALVDNNLKQRTIRLTGNHADKLKIVRSPDEKRLNQLSLVPLTSNNYAASIDLKLPSNLDIGDYNGDLDLNICYDAQCDYPVAGSPLKVPMDFVIEAPAQVASSALAVNERLRFEYSVQDAAYIPGLNVLAMTSTSPSNSLYIYDLATGKTQNFNLSGEPLALSVDNLAKQGRVVVAMEYQAEVFDFSSNKTATPDRKIISLSSHRPSITVRRNDLFATGGALEKVDIATQISETSLGVNWYWPDIKLSSNGDVLLGLESSLSPQGFSGVFIESGQWNLQNTDDEYHGDYSHSGKFWFDKAGEQYIDGNGNYYTLKNGNRLALKWAGQLPLSSVDNSYKPSITAFIDNGSQYVIAEGEQSRQLRVIDKNSNLIVETFEATNRDDPWYTREEHIQFAFVTDGGQLYMIKALNDHISSWNYLEPELVRVK
ncbi:PKD domain-containing protein [Vibrio navarrensis]|uniref:PKD domain-containing protein n=1 Tax=Vibrio navarrensis TaxID=29495 RepID=UPI001865FB54|nr:PKD domain-containing protein [Vibrio navarrensis]MBE3651934.1 PKD domain-containing protein [Vibrio navarrensis]